MIRFKEEIDRYMSMEWHIHKTITKERIEEYKAKLLKAKEEIEEALKIYYVSASDYILINEAKLEERLRLINQEINYCDWYLQYLEDLAEGRLFKWRWKEPLMEWKDGRYEYDTGKVIAWYKVSQPATMYIVEWGFDEKDENLCKFIPYGFDCPFARVKRFKDKRKMERYIEELKKWLEETAKQFEIPTHIKFYERMHKEMWIPKERIK
ncbi:MAG: hypothetical protein DRI61_11370 [Chloroflexi bacterium]|nr:MAG: hypothetical protein DRI61_11370 [Chloroflexota bacterium]